MSAPLEDNLKAQINTSYTPSEEDQKWRKHVYQRKQDMGQSRAKYELLWDKWEKQWESWLPPKKNWQSQIVPPYTTSIVEAELSEMVDQDQRPRVSARGSEDKPKAIVINKTVDYTWEIGDGAVELYKVTKDALIFGTGIAQEMYWKDVRQVRSLVKYDSTKGIEEYEDKEVTDFDDVYMEAVKLQDFYIDENARSINRGPSKANDCIRRYIMTLDKFKDIYSGPIWDPKGMAKYVVAGGDTNYYEYYKPPEGLSKDQVEVLWYWSRVPDKLVIVANDVVIRGAPNPYNHKQLPFAQALDVMRPHQFYHKGEPELLESIQEELNTIRRQRLDRVHLDIDKMFLVTNRDVLTDQDLTASPHKAIFVDDPSSIKPLEYGQTPQTAYLEEDRLKEDGERVTGVDVRSQSVNQTGSATAAAILKEATQKRLRMKIWMLTKTFLMEQTRLRVANIQQYYQEPKLQEIIGAGEADLATAIQNAKITEVNGKKYMKMPRTISTNDIQLNRNGKLIDQLPKRGQNFFDIQPEDLIPSRGGFNYIVSSEPTFPVSKPLQQQKVNELFQHPVMIFAVENGLIDPKKTADKMLEINDFDPEDFELNQQKQPAISPEVMVQLADEENHMMLQGKDVGGTPFANRQHTEIHLAFMQSKDFIDAWRQNQDILRIFITHISQEEDAQNKRQGAPQAPPQTGSQPGQQPPGPLPPPPGAPPSAGNIGAQGNPAAGVAASPAQAAAGARAVGPTQING